MSDHELLEAAAKAAGIQYTISKNGTFLIAPYSNSPAKRSWNPLTDDGDAFRLAVRLRIEVRQFDSGFVEACRFAFDPYREDHDQDATAATRRAITRAAAEIGLNIKE